MTPQDGEYMNWYANVFALVYGHGAIFRPLPRFVAWFDILLTSAHLDAALYPHHGPVPHFSVFVPPLSRDDCCSGASVQHSLCRSNPETPNTTQCHIERQPSQVWPVASQGRHEVLTLSISRTPTLEAW